MLLTHSTALHRNADESAQEGQTDAPALEDAVNLHFVCFIAKDGHLYELGGH